MSSGFFSCTTWALLSAMLESAPPRNILALIINYHLQCILVLNLWNPHPDSPSAVDRGAATLWLLTWGAGVKWLC